MCYVQQHIAALPLNIIVKLYMAPLILKITLAYPDFGLPVSTVASIFSHTFQTLSLSEYDNFLL